ncbi:MAG: DUF2232 domain-containing protein [Candidatus Pacebacteria bacterium]|nr:DUF2232 domain-containing protein [Candidatus Paceibacterota bacterium]
MSIKTIILSVLFGLTSALFIALPMAASGGGGTVIAREILIMLSTLPIFMAVLGYGQLSGLLAMAVAMMTSYSLTESWVLAVFTLVITMPALLLASVALVRKVTTERTTRQVPADLSGGIKSATELSISVSWVQGALIIIALVIMGVMVMTGVFVAIGLTGTLEPIAFLKEAMQRGIVQMIAPMTMDELAKMVGDAKLVEQSLAMLAKFPSIFIMGWLLMLALNGILAQGLLMKFNAELRPAPQMGQISIPFWYSGLAIVLMILSFAGSNWLGFVASNLLLIVSFGLIFGGLGLLHLLSQKWPYRLSWLLLCYIMIIVSQGLLLIPLMVLGILEPWVQLRQRLIN